MGRDLYGGEIFNVQFSTLRKGNGRVNSQSIIIGIVCYFDD